MDGWMCIWCMDGEGEGLDNGGLCVGGGSGGCCGCQCVSNVASPPLLPLTPVLLALLAATSAPVLTHIHTQNHTHTHLQPLPSSPPSLSLPNAHPPPR